MKKILQISLVVALVVGVIGGGAYAYDSFTGNNIENIEVAYFGDNGVEQVGNLGTKSSTSNNFSKDINLDSAGYKIDDSYVIDSSGNGTFTGTMNVTGASTFTGAVDASIFTEGGGVYASTTMATTATLVASDLIANNYFALTPNVANTALTLPATSTLATMIPNAGDRREILIENVSAVTATTTTIVAGAGMDLQEADGQNVVIGGNNYALVTLWRKSNTDMVVTVTETIPAD